MKFKQGQELKIAIDRSGGWQLFPAKIMSVHKRTVKLELLDQNIYRDKIRIIISKRDLIEELKQQ